MSSLLLTGNEVPYSHSDLSSASQMVKGKPLRDWNRPVPKQKYELSIFLCALHKGRANQCYCIAHVSIRLVPRDFRGL